MNNRYRFRMEGVVRSSSSRHQKYRNPISILRYLYNSLDDSTRFSGAWKWRLNPGWHSTCSNDFDETLVADPRSTVTPIYRACCARQSAWNAPRLSNNRGFATRRDRVVPVHPIIRRLPLIIYNLQSGLMFRRSIFAIDSIRFVDKQSGENISHSCNKFERDAFLCLMNFNKFGEKGESFTCLLNCSEW